MKKLSGWAIGHTCNLKLCSSESNNIFTFFPLYYFSLNKIFREAHILNFAQKVPIEGEENANILF